MSNIKLEVGKAYRNRKGEEVKIVENDGLPEFPYKGSDDEWYTESGIWSFDFRKTPEDLIEEVEELPEARYTFKIPDGVKEIAVEQVGNRIIVEMVPEKEPKPGDVMINKHGSVYIFKEVMSDNYHEYYALLGEIGRLSIGSWCYHGRPATPEEAQPLFDALKKAGNKWNPETMQVEDVPESDRIREWVEANIKDGYYNQEDVAEAIEAYLNQKEGEK